MDTPALSDNGVRPSYWLVRWLFLRWMGLIYLIAFLSFYVQILGLIGSRGILPAAEFFAAVEQRFGPGGFWLVPGVLWFDASDAALQGVALAGALLAVLVIAGVAQQVALALAYIAYMSLVSAGQTFMSFQWDALLLECGFLAIFFAPSQLWPRPARQAEPSRLALWLLRWLLFRLTFASGMVKFTSGDPTWRSLTALTFHYYTQPLPLPSAWYIQQLPLWVHKFSAAMVFLVEVVAPLLIFAPRRLRMIGAGLMAGLQVLILFSGNYAFFNWLTLALCVTLLDDAALETVTRRIPQRIRHWLPRVAPGDDARGRAFVTEVGLRVVAVIMALLGIIMITRQFAPAIVPRPALAVASRVAPFRIANRYGLFAVMTTSRPEIIIEGSDDGVNWLEYEFPSKPGDLARAPRVVAPHQPRLDWQMWFAALGGVERNRWVVSMMQLLLEGSPQVEALLESNPFPDEPPLFVRAVIYDYQFTDFAERRESGAWWKREFRGEYVPPLTVGSFEQ